MNDRKWTSQDIPSQTGKRILITGANSGIGFESARVMAGLGAQVILACRNEAKAVSAMAKIRNQFPKAQLHFLPLDLGSLDSVHVMANMFSEQYDSLDVLLNNAGVMWLPQGMTEDGFESQIGINHLGHFALTGLLMPALLNRAGSRVVTVSSIAHRSGNLDFEDLFFERRRYGKQDAYGQSKLANLVFARELERKLNASGAQTMSVAVHPGVTSTNLATPGLQQSGSVLLAKLVKMVTPLVTQSATKGALPSLYAATSNEIEGGEYIGPDRFYGTFGYPTAATSTRRSNNPDIARKLWQVSEKLTGVQYPLSATT
ncbi:SDR family NAD(P)-dependent oxidoreductase [Ketobacter sp. MCCC 1A13808]|uniref:oxidoreductase n=1 Tax=Ketobacter sp. MCCC 1A13808 TaxID=2602738 RepID=UPI000F1C420D|nr:oxidoreductase [Ketobacter sp. MCCC 1A13808]MVF11104.1 SDR family NAD(P)-dependent oxidoreductase [Ketobacter sp. MCCC 1A13808]RLP52248.1 MAG: SDR family NAD(P)-dependent oxidoreductase [Ketobacter sp.]|tara:strand:+ start:142 stop:1089 length:948 start_codon:yes stop_codon:yes gene_type:complete